MSPRQGALLIPRVTSSVLRTNTPDAASLSELHAFVLELGRGLALAGAAVTETQDRLTAVAAAQGVRDARIMVFPTALMIAFGRAGSAAIEVIPQFEGTLRLDQVSALYELIGAAERAKIDPSDGLRRLEAIHSMPPRHGICVALLAYIAMVVGLSLVLQPTVTDVAVAAGLGAIVALLDLVARSRHSLSALMPVIAATVVSALGFVAVKHGAADPGLRAMIAPLVMFLPGGPLTTATVELASGQMIAGASRLVFGSVQMLLLAFGIVAGVELVGLPSESVLHDEHINLLGWWAPWLGVLVFGIAAAWYLSAPRGALKWLLAVLLAAWVGQLAGNLVFGAAVSGFFGALVMTPIAMLVARLPHGPPSQVTFLPAFWLLVPGALGLIGVTEIVGNPATASLADLAKPIGSVVSIALGVLAGVSVYRGVSSPKPWLRQERHRRRGPSSARPGRDAHRTPTRDETGVRRVE